MSDYSTLRGEPGVITAPGTAPVYAASLLTNEDETEVVLATPKGMEPLEVSRIDQDGSSGRLVLVTNKMKYNWRPIREADGVWISKHRIPLPIDAIPGIAVSGDIVDTEMLSAFSDSDSPYVLGVVYETSEGKWVRSGGQFLPIAGDDTTYDTMDRIIIDPAKSSDFLDLYDRNYVTVSDAAGFESADSE
ncbi:hypothetical protein SEA_PAULODIABOLI_86 [Microbacterium phage PauloDiaboli]|nr:hypothetical protein SEA_PAULODIABOLI_86 [Microbacterium phage PauloDiaboli]